MDSVRHAYFNPVNQNELLRLWSVSERTEPQPATVKTRLFKLTPSVSDAFGRQIGRTSPARTNVVSRLSEEREGLPPALCARRTLTGEGDVLGERQQRDVVDELPVVQVSGMRGRALDRHVHRRRAVRDFAVQVQVAQTHQPPGIGRKNNPRRGPVRRRDGTGRPLSRGRVHVRREAFGQTDQTVGRRYHVPARYQRARALPAERRRPVPVVLLVSDGRDPRPGA